MITFNNVSIAFDRQEVFTNANLTIKPAEFVSIVGDTGVGKTTLLRLIYFDVYPDKGAVKVGEFTSTTIRRKDIPKVRRSLGIVFQDFKLLDDRNVYDNVAFTLVVTGARRSEMSKRVLRALADVGLSHKRNNMPHELSGGELQRVVIARALINEPHVLLADEPTGNLDATASLEILQLLKTINARGTAVILATHNHKLVRKSGSRIIQIRNGTILDIASLEDM